MLLLRALLLQAACAATALANPALHAGQRLFGGQQPLVAHMPGHTQALPADAARCINCHAAPGLTATRGQGLGPSLGSRHLMEPQARRGGPVSRYDAASLCRVLRDGVDPAGVLLGSAMPRYRIDDAGCRYLWTLLTSDLK